MRTLTVTAGTVLLARAAHDQGPTTLVGDSRYTERVAYQPSDLASQLGIRGALHHAGSR